MFKNICLCNQTYQYARHFSPSDLDPPKEQLRGRILQKLIKVDLCQTTIVFESCKQVFKKPSIARKGGEQHFVLKVANKFKNQALLIKKERFFIEIKFKFKKLSKLLIQEESSAMEPVNVALTDYSSLRLTL